MPRRHVNNDIFSFKRLAGAFVVIYATTALIPTLAGGQAKSVIKVQGVVRDQQKRLISGAVITAGGAEASPTNSDTNGLFHIDLLNVSYGDVVSLQISKLGYQGISQQIAAMPSLVNAFVLFPNAASQDTTSALAGAFEKVDVIYREVDYFRAGVKPTQPLQNPPFAQIWSIY